MAVVDMANLVGDHGDDLVLVQLLEHVVVEDYQVCGA